jgi:dipeptidyl aminopeptidase/acylaminoacyl peptidase
MLRSCRARWLRGFVIPVVLLLNACGGASSNDRPSGTAFDFTPPTVAQLQEIQTLWASRDLAAKNVSIFYRDDSNSGYELRIYQHVVGGRTHFGAVTIPKSSSRTSFPVVLFAAGLSQDNPTMDIGRWAQAAQARLGQAVFIVPAFRGVTLIYNGITASAAGDFCDAYDGATDDAIALMNVVEADVPQADFSRLMVRGGSRGGNIALLLAVRDPRVTVVSAGSAPTDFYRADVAKHYGRQYQCQFIEGKTADESRRRILASSPLRFPVLRNVTKVYLDQGSADDVVPPWNAEEMAAALRAQGVNLEYHLYAGYGHDLNESAEFREVQNQIYNQFLSDP